MDLYDRIDHILNEKNMSRRKMAQLAGISEYTIAAAFRRKSKKYPIENVQKIAAVLGVPWYELMGLEDLGGGVYGHEGTPEGYAKLQANYERFHGEEAKRREALSQHFDALNPDGQNEAVKRVGELTELPRYQK